MNALKAQGRSRDTLPYKAPFQPWGSWFALVGTWLAIVGSMYGSDRYNTATAIITLFKGFDTFIPFTKDTFVTSYIALPVFVLLFGGYKFYYKTKRIPAAHVDLVTGLATIDEEEQNFLKEQEALGPRSTRQRLWDSL